MSERHFKNKLDEKEGKREVQVKELGEARNHLLAEIFSHPPTNPEYVIY
jgi:hypothetical protein